MNVNLYRGTTIKSKEVKRLLASVMVILMIFSIMPFKAYANEVSEGIKVNSLLDYDEIYGGASGTKSSSV